MRNLCGPESGLLIGVDTKKDKARLDAAYNDALGVTAAFNLNVLNHAGLGGYCEWLLSAQRAWQVFSPQRCTGILIRSRFGSLATRHAAARRRITAFTLS